LQNGLRSWKNPGVPRFYHPSGLSGASATPPELADSPMLALRSQLYPVFPGVVAQAEQQQGKPLPIGLPQRMMFTRWKSGAAQFGQNAVSYVQAYRQDAARVREMLAAANVPAVIDSPASAARAMGATSMPEQYADPGISEVPVSRGYLSPDRYVTADQLVSFVDRDKASRLLAAQDASVRASSAMQEINAVRSAIHSRILDPNARRPWFMPKR